MIATTEDRAVVGRINSRLEQFALETGESFGGLRWRIWGHLFGIVRVGGDRAPFDSYLREAGDDGPQYPTVAAAVTAAKEAGHETAAAALSAASLRQEALLGSAEAERLLRRSAEAMADRLCSGEVTPGPDDQWTFVSDQVPLRDFVVGPAQELSRRHRNSLRSRIFSRSIESAPAGERLCRLASGVVDVLAPFYEAVGHLRVGEKAAGVEKAAQYPKALLEDTADLLQVWRAGEFEGLTAEQVRNALRYWETRSSRSGA